MSQCTIIAESDKVVLVIEGKRVCDMPPQVAREMAKWLVAQAKKVEDAQNATQLIIDQARMQRAGFPFGLSSDPRIVEAARTEAQWGDVRREIPLRGIEPRSAVGTPSIKRG